MRFLVRLLLSLLLILGLIRMVIFLLYAAAMLPTPLEAHNLEAKMVLLAWRAQQGLSLYPPWWNYPHVSNFFGPVYFVLVGLLGRLVDADIRGLFLIGRAITFASCLLTSLVLVAWIGRRYGRGAALAGGVLSLGSGPMYGFAVMARPDVPAELLGLGGFVLSVGSARGGGLSGIALLILAVLTKQTTAVFVVAAAAALALSGEWRRALRVLGGVGAGMLVVVVAVNSLVEPYFAVSLLGEAQMPWSFDNWWIILVRTCTATPDLLFLPVVGLGLWLGGRPREVVPATLTVVLLAGSLVLSGKRGSDMNYYHGLRISEAMAVGALWHAGHAAAERRRGRSVALAVVTALAVASVAPCILAGMGQASHAWRRKSYFEGPDGRLVLHAYQIAFAQARDPHVAMLTDSGLIDLYQGERAAFGDPWLFRQLVEIGRIRPATIEDRINNQYYDIIINVHDIESALYLGQDFRWPEVLLGPARARYELTRAAPGLFFYGRRGGAAVPPPGASRAGGAAP